MTLAHALVGFMIGQIITFEGIDLKRFITYILSLFVAGIFIVYPVLSLLCLVYSLDVQSSPALILGISYIIHKTMWKLLEIPHEYPLY